ncbi:MULTISPECIES: YgjV family protein [Rheinheimera]|uniref:YgjV family protein n=1 Tax=Rheinheimera aquimaris TaxID=412437 RepID=A0ABP3NDZ6_9GAMM|nr:MULTISPECIES: YgjV family protein [Rheinheimera]MCB5212066.1 YgjV family protein [Rheinheimera aquimaris]
MPEFTLLFVLSQLLAALAFTSGIIAFQQHQRSAMLKFWFVSALLNACHFAVLAQYQAALFVGLTSVRFLVAAVSPRLHWMYVFLVLSSLLFFISYSNPINLLPYLAAIVGTVGSFQKNVTLVRILMAIGASAWIVHNLLVGSPVAVLMELAFLSSNLVGYIRSRKLNPAADPGQ